MNTRKRVLILCTGNSCRSHLAQVIWTDLGNGHWEAESAGSHPTGHVHPLAIRALQEKGLPVEGLKSKSLDKFLLQEIDLVITVCDNAKENCPVLPGAKETLHWPFDDPADTQGSTEEKMSVFRRVRDEIKTAITSYLKNQVQHGLPMSSTINPTLTPEASVDGLKLIEMALVEDLGSADIGTGLDCTTNSIVPQQAVASAAFVSREDGIVCGLEVCKLAIEKHAPDLNLNCVFNDGHPVSASETIAILSGPARQILLLERTCLNFLGRLSGISTLTNRYVKLVEGTGAKVFDTRKTLPGWRRLEKYAVRCGGGENHRMGLYDAVMIKDNHLAFHRSHVEDSRDTIPNALKKTREWIDNNSQKLIDGTETIIQLEVDSLDQLEIALGCAPHIVLLDNMTIDQLTQAVRMRDRSAPDVLLEASGGVDLSTIGNIARTGVERISVGALTHSAINFDIGLDWQP